MKLRIAGISEDSFVDGPGLRFVVFFQGCPYACPGCHNAATWEMDAGEEVTTSRLQTKWRANFLLDGITFSGGEPLAQKAALFDLVKRAKADNLNVTLYTGDTYENIIAANDKMTLQILKYVDYLIDGPFVMRKRSNAVLYRGSTNQRIIDIKKTSATKTLVLINNYRDFTV